MPLSARVRSTGTACPCGYGCSVRKSAMTPAAVANSFLSPLSICFYQYLCNPFPTFMHESGAKLGTPGLCTGKGLGETGRHVLLHAGVLGRVSPFKSRIKKGPRRGPALAGYDATFPGSSLLWRGYSLQGTLSFPRSSSYPCSASDLIPPYKGI